ncbi:MULTISPECIES: hypothetical protein [unclassified Rhizobium]|jgi:hypothetical protein|uniref:hypothetical protein n=1 Tax=unclassified Rhizobium TaxID=2613769 RepID=UPI000DDB2D2D|nr:MULTISPECIES: hypothetical protein [unclassified Rhizobium]MBB3446999.1 hypothetical protein [Rhizobium sp. BK379]MBB3565539.1 hypothetical protein [Rhizobium sp. BK512]
MTEFRDISIVELSEGASGAAVGPLTTMVLQLSGVAPVDRANAFNESWKESASVMRRAATATGDTITLACMPYELQGQITELNRIIAETNSSYRDGLEQAAARQDAELKDLKATLKSPQPK